MVFGKCGILVFIMWIIKDFLFGWSWIRRCLFRRLGRRIFFSLSFGLSFILKMWLRSLFRILFRNFFFFKWRKEFLVMRFIVFLRLLCFWGFMLCRLSLGIIIKKCISLGILVLSGWFFKEWWISINLLGISGRIGFRCGMWNIVGCLKIMLCWNIWRLFRIWKCMELIILR